MDKVVYVLGAGFSHPVGIPVMSEFISVAKNIYEKEDRPKELDYFKGILDEMNQVQQTNYRVDSGHIEEVLSILEMQRLIGRNDGSSPYKRFIRDVIVMSTPPVPDVPDLENYTDHALGAFGNMQQNWSHYGPFVASLFGLQIQVSSERPFKVIGASVKPTQATYSVITFNWDTLLDDILSYIGLYIANNLKLRFGEFEPRKRPDEIHVVPLLKLHGCVTNPESIQLPTWNKNMYSEDRRQLLTLAHSILTNANQIRIIGYSLPDADTHVKYLLKLAGRDVFNLKKIDIICHASDKAEEDRLVARYRDFIGLNKGRFKNTNVIDYFTTIWSSTHGGTDFSKLEDRHEEFFDSGSLKL
ncbi:MAG: SIR2 family protein [Thaumarchaeota archaeon]|nr:SIR2 family protein [Nitrososphaerota archaeon]